MTLPKWFQSLPMDLIRKKAMAHKLDSYLVAAVVQVESGGNPWAIRYEKNYKWSHDIEFLAERTGSTLDTIEMMQKTSWGPMQVMGGTAYELGLSLEVNRKDRSPVGLLSWNLGLEYGCRYLSLQRRKYGPNPQSIYAAYNGGSPRLTWDKKYQNQEAVDRFMRFYEEIA